MRALAEMEREGLAPNLACLHAGLGAVPGAAQSGRADDVELQKLYRFTRWNDVDLWRNCRNTALRQAAGELPLCRLRRR